MAITAIRGTFFDFTDDPWKHVGSEHDAARFTLDGLLVIDDGIIVAFGDFDEVAPSYPGLDPTVIADRIIMPGFIDGHIHVPQTRVLGAFGQQLLPWLNDTVFPEEAKYSDRGYAREGSERFFENVLAGGTTTVQAFTTTSPVATEEFFEAASRRNMLVIGGVTGIDQFAPEGTTSTPEQFYADSTAMIEKYHGTGRNLYAITPRFALGATEQLLEACQKLKQEHPDLWVNTHISENPAEIAGVLQAHPDCTDYLGVYEKYDLVGPKFSGGHGIWLSDNEFARMSDSGAAVVFCPCSNLFLGSGVFRLGKATDPDKRVRMSFGTDMGGGNRFSMVSVLDEAYKVGMLGNTLLDGSTNRVTQDLAQSERSKLSPYRAFWSVTLGGAEGLYIDDRVGNFEVGKEADFVALDYTAGPPAMAWHQELFFGDAGPTTMEEAAHALFSIMMVGDDRNVDETWVSGVRLYKKA
ncbi:guanine deaminase [Agreia bicolorata]|uniref:Guanine deaminase n=1 Tax=Agreia bicolorata TaxID=110935 RepID=A0ABR5CDG8_9MICO|nr:guanine deaminase [Agreia bicolorata]KJC63690.1 guanine deaminase [Agreia bicolorata]